jgi:hypothetical protein
MLAIGKERSPVWIAELTAGAEAILFACTKALDEKKPVLLGLPLLCQTRVLANRVYLCSLISAELDVRSGAIDVENILTKVKLIETLDPCARGFRALKIKPLSR